MDLNDFVYYAIADFDPKPTQDMIDSAVAHAQSETGVKIDSVSITDRGFLYLKNRFVAQILRTMLLRKHDYYAHSGLSLNQVFQNLRSLLDDVEAEWKKYEGEIKASRMKSNGVSLFGVVSNKFRYDRHGKRIY